MLFRSNHAAVLVHLDRVNQEVVAFIAVGFTRTFERGVNRTQTMLQDLREAEQCRQTLALCFAGAISARIFLGANGKKNDGEKPDEKGEEK